MLVSVDDGGRATARRGQPRPAGHRRLPLRQGLQLPRPASTPRTGCCIRWSATGAKGSGEFRRATWDEALDRVAGRAAGRDRRARRRGDPALQLQGHDGAAPGRPDERAGDERAGRHRARAHDLRDRRASTGVAATHGISPEVDPERWPLARYVLLWGWNPMSTAPHLWRLLLEARRNGARLVVVDPYRSRTARVADEHLQPLPGTDAALALGMMRAVVDAGLADEEWCRAHTTGLRRAARAAGGVPGGALRARRAACAAETIARDRAASSPRPSPALLRLGVGAQRHKGAPAGVPHDRLPARAHRRLAPRGRRLLLHPHRHRGRAVRARRSARGPAARADVRSINMSQLGRRAHRPRARPAGEGARVLELQSRRRSRRSRAGCWRGCAARTCSPWCSSSS